MFAVKCAYKTMPFTCLGCSLVITTLMFGFHLKIFEGPMTDVTNMDFRSINNCMWNVVITLATCGYGDLFPVTFFGRIVGTIITFWGLFIASAITVVITDQLELETREFNSFKMMNMLIL
jgi:hypothetical protein